MPARRSKVRRILRTAGFAVIAYIVLSATCVLTLRWVDPPTTAFIARDRIGAWWHGERGYVYRHQWVDLRHIAKPMQLAVIASEDQKFPEHWGFDFQQIDDALSEHGKRLRGASTISQQTAKNLFLWPGHSWIRKGIEAYFTVLIETLWSKRRILEVYLNCAEFGRGIYGVEAAGQTFFHTSAANLTPAQAALLAAVLPNPRRLHAARPSAYVRERQGQILGQMSGLGGVSYLKSIN